MIKYSDKAQQDLQDIITYTLRQWGKEQTAKYLKSIENSIKTLAINPNIGVFCNKITLSLQCFPIKNHMVYYMKKEKGILILRILNQYRHPNNLQ